MVQLHPVLEFLAGVAALGAVLAVVGIAVDLALRNSGGSRPRDLLLEASGFTWAFGAFVVVVFVAWVYIVQGMLFEAAMFGLVGALVLYLVAFFIYPEAKGAFGGEEAPE